MQVAKRVVLFLLTNFLIIITLSMVMRLLGVQPYLTQKGIDYQSLLVFCTIWGFGGAFISLALSRVMAKWMMGVKVINPHSANSHEAWLYNKVQQLAKQAGIKGEPEVGIYESPEVNAFATGPTQNRSLVAVSTGLLHQMDRDGVEGVLAHEVAHIANGDMVTMTLIQGVVNAFVMFFARIIAWSLSQFVDEEKRGIVNFIAVFVLEIAFSLLGMVVVAGFSRYREYRADAGGAGLVGKGKMVGALASLQRSLNHMVEIPEEPKAMASFKISSPGKSGLAALLSSHPPLDERILRLKQMG
jgi:heat shock protein HtpX